MSSYWRLYGRDLVQDKNEHREGQAAISLLITTVGRYLRGNLLDYGCGKGRLAQFFDPLTYIGYDINADMMQQAQQDNPEHCFTCSLAGALAYNADCTLLYTVISMWDDAEAAAIMHQFRSRLIVIGEIADSRWANSSASLPRIYNRDVSQLDDIMAGCGYKRIAHEKALHERYKSWDNDYDKHMHILVYEYGNKT